SGIRTSPSFRISTGPPSAVVGEARSAPEREQSFVNARPCLPDGPIATARADTIGEEHGRTAGHRVAPQARPSESEVSKGERARARARGRIGAGLAVEAEAERASGAFTHEVSERFSGKPTGAMAGQTREHRHAEAEHVAGRSEQARVPGEAVSGVGPGVFVVHDPAHEAPPEIDVFGRRDARGDIFRRAKPLPRRASRQAERP